MQGKTVAKVVHDPIFERLFISFTDDTFIIISAVVDGRSEDSELRFPLPDIFEDGQHLIEIGACTEEEIEGWKKAREEANEAQRKKLRREEFERLKKEFGDES